MFWRKLLGAGVVLAILAAASWLPVPAGHALPASTPPATSLARPALAPPPSWPVAAPDPVQAVQAFFWSLGIAVAGQHGAPAKVDAATAGPFARAYTYLSPQWQARQAFAEFLRQWTPVQHLDLLATVPAGTAGGGSTTSRVFVEVRELSAGADGATPLCLCFAYGFFTAVATSHGFRLSGGRLIPEDFTPTLVGNRSAGAAATAAAKAVAAARGWSGPPSASVRLTPQPHHQATASVAISHHAVTVHLYELASGDWIAVRSSA